MTSERKLISILPRGLRKLTIVFAAAVCAEICLTLFVIPLILFNEALIDFHAMSKDSGYYLYLCLSIFGFCFLYNFDGPEFESIFEYADSRVLRYAFGYVCITLMFLTFCILAGLVLYSIGTLLIAAFVLTIAVYCGGYIRGWLTFCVKV